VPSGGLALDVEPVGMDSVGRRGNGLNPEGATMPASCVDEDMKSARTSTTATATKQETKVSTASPISRCLRVPLRPTARLAPFFAPHLCCGALGTFVAIASGTALRRGRVPVGILFGLVFAVMVGT
jgi:hypothetical protein